MTAEILHALQEAIKDTKFPTLGELIYHLHKWELTLTSPDADNGNFWDNWFTVIGQHVTGQYDLDSFAEIVQADWTFETTSSELNRETSLSKQQIQLERLYNECVRKTPTSLNDSTLKSQLPHDSTKILEWVEQNCSRIFKLNFYNWQSGEIIHIAQSPSLGQTDAIYENIVIVYDPDLNSMRSLVFKRNLFTTLKDYCNAILVALTETQELTKLLSRKFSEIDTHDLPTFIAENLKAIGQIQVLTDFTKTILSSTDDDPKDAVNLNLFTKYQQQLMDQDNDDAEKILIELKTCYAHCALRASEEVLEKRMAKYRQDVLLLQEKEEQILIENDRLETLIEEAEKEKKRKEEKIKELESQLATANAEKKRLLEEEIAQLKALDDQKQQLLKQKEEYAWNLLKKELLSVEVSYDNLVKHSTWRNSMSTSSSLEQISQKLLSLFNFAGLNPENREFLLNFSRNNNTTQNKEDLFLLLDSVFQPPNIGYNSKDSSILEVSGRQILTSDILSRISKYNFSQLRIFSGTVLYIDTDFNNSSFHGKNIVICSPKVVVTRQSLINTSGTHGTPTGIPGKAPDGQEEGRDGVDGNHGTEGESAGNVYIQSHQFGNPNNLTIIANGGNGGQGQDGGQGRDGRNGYNGRDGFVEEENWWTSTVCCKIDRGQDGQQGQRGGSGGIAGLGGEGGRAGEIFIQPPNDKVKVERKEGQQGRDGNPGRGAKGGSGGHNGVDHGVAWHNYKFASGEFRYARGKLDKRPQKVWYGGNGYELIVMRSEWDVRNSRALYGQQGTDGQFRGNTNSRRRAVAKSIPSKQEISQTFSNVLNQFGQKQHAQNQIAANLAANLNQQQSALKASEERARFDKISRDQATAKTNSLITDTTNNLNITTEEKNRLEASLVGLNNDLEKSMQDLEKTKDAVKQVQASAAAIVKEIQGHMHQIASVVHQHQKQQSQQQLESMATNHQQNVMRDFDSSHLRTKVSILPKRVKQIEEDEKNKKGKDLEVRTEEKIQAKAKFWIQNNPKQWEKLQKIFNVSKPDCISLFAAVRNDQQFLNDIAIEKTYSKMAKFQNQEEGAETMLIFDHLYDILHSHAEKWFIKQCSAIEVIKEFVDKLDDLLKIVNNVIERSINLVNPNFDYLSGYKTFLSVAGNTSKYIQQTGDTLWEAFGIQLCGIGQSSFWFTSKKSIETIIIEHMDKLISTLVSIYRTSNSSKRQSKINENIVLLKKMIFIFNYVEADRSSPDEMKLQLTQLSEIQKKYESLILIVSPEDTELFQTILQLGQEIYENFVDNFQKVEIQLIQDSIIATETNQRKKTALANQVNKFVEKLESSFSSMSFETRIQNYVALRENVLKERSPEEALTNGPKNILDGLSNIPSQHDLKQAVNNLKNVIKKLRIDFEVKNKTPEEIFEEIRNQQAELLSTCHLVNQLDRIEMNDLIEINKSLGNFYFKLAQSLNTFPPAMFQTLRELQVVLFKFWEGEINANFDNIYILHEKQMNNLDAMRDSVLKTIENYLQTTESILFKEEFLECLKIQLIKLTQGHLSLDLKTGQHTGTTAETFIKGLQSEVSDTIEHSKNLPDTITKLCKIINSTTRSMTQNYLQSSSFQNYPDIFHSIETFLDSPLNFGVFHKISKSVIESGSNQQNELLEQLALLLMYSYQIPAESFQVQSCEKTATLPKTDSIKITPEMELESLFEYLESHVTNALSQASIEGILNTISTVTSHNYLEYGSSLKSLMNYYLEIRFKSTKEGHERVTASMKSLLIIFIQNPTTVFSYSEPIEHFAQGIISITKTISTTLDDTVPLINKIFVESCVKFFSLKSIPTLPPTVRAQIWNLFSNNTKLSNIIPTVMEEIGEDVDAFEYAWLSPFLSILREFIKQLPSEFPTTCYEIHQMCQEILDTSDLIKRFLENNTSKFVSECSTPLITVVIDFCRRVCLKSLQNQYGETNEYIEAVQFINQAEFAFWAIFQGQERELSTLTQIFTAMDNENYKQTISTIFAQKCSEAFDHKMSTFPADFSKHWISSCGLNKVDEGNPLWIKFATAVFFLSSNANTNETSLCERTFLGGLVFRPEFSKIDAVNYFLQSKSKLDNRISTALLYNQDTNETNFTFLNFEEQEIVTSILEIAYISQVDTMMTKVKNILRKNSSDEWQTQLQSLYMDLQLQNILDLFTSNFTFEANEDFKIFQNLLSKFSTSHQHDHESTMDLFAAAGKINPLLRDTVEDLVHLKHLFNRCYVFADDKSILNVFFQHVYKNCKTQEIHLTELNDLLGRSVDIPPLQLLKITLSSNPENWIEGILLAIVSMNIQILLDKGQDTNMECSDSVSRADDVDVPGMTVKFEKLKPGFLKNRLLATLADKVSDEIEYVSPATVTKDRQTLIAIFNNIESCENILTEEFIEALKTDSFFRWSRIFRKYLLQHKFGSEELTTAILNFEGQHGSSASEKLIKYVEGLVNKDQLLEIFQHFNRLSWTFDEILLQKLSTATSFDSIISICEEYTIAYLKKDRNASDIINIMTADPGNEGIFDDYLRRNPISKEKDAPLDICQLEKLIQGIKSTAKKTSVIFSDITKEIGQYTKSDIELWVKMFNKLDNPEKMQNARKHTDEMIAVTSQALVILNGYPPRDTQLISVVLLLDHSLKGRSSLAEVSTGEGKTIILAMVVTIRALCGDDVDIITSSSVLAKANLQEVTDYYALFGITSSVNCDEACERDEKIRKERYQSRVIYGDVGSFQRDILLTEFFNKNITMGRKADVVFVDEVDSMLLDKGENVLYLSHQIPELKYLWPLTIEIWQGVHARDVALGREQDVVLVVRFIQRRIAECDIVVPKCLTKFIDHRLVHWVRNAFLAKSIQEKDSYVVANVDRKGHKVVIMDKDTGVEQVNMQWSCGLHQYVQLKHSDKLSAESLKSVFMSNIAYIQRFKGKLFGISGTLGSKVEQDLLAKIYSVGFFKIPRFKARRCVEFEEVVAENSTEWLDQIQRCAESMVKDRRAVLVICENVDMVDCIGKRLKNTFKYDQVYSYESSFDKDFTRRKEAGPLTAGDVIVATNIAGRGTDLKIDDLLNKAGGIHVILSYVPGNVRIEEQAFGRTARAGANGSVQYIINSQASRRSKNSGGRILRLDDFKYERDRSERERLDQFRVKSIPQIECEHDLSQRFGLILKKIKERIQNMPEAIINLHIENLQNRWAFWLDSMSERIRMTHSQKDVILREFHNFEQVILQNCNNILLGNDCNQGFETGPVEMTKLGRHYEEDEKISEALSHYNRAIKTDPLFSEVAHYYTASCIIKQTDEGVYSKRKAIGHLKIAEKLMRQRMNALFASSQALQLVDDMRREMGQGTSTNRYEDQVKNQAELLKVHLGKISDAIGCQIDGEYLKGIKNVLDEAEGTEIFDVLRRHGSILKNYRFSRKTQINSSASVPDKEQVKIPRAELEGQFNNIEWPHTLEYCKKEILCFMNDKIHGSGSGRGVDEKMFEKFILTKDDFWNLLRSNNFISQEDDEREELFVAYKENQKKYDDHQFPTDLADFKSIFGKMFSDMDKSTFDESALEMFELTKEQQEKAMKLFKEMGILQKKKLKFATVKSELKYDRVKGKWTGMPHGLLMFESLVAAIIEEVGEDGNVTCKIEIGMNDVPLFETKALGTGQLWSFMLDSGIIKPPKVNFNISHAETQSKIDSRFNEIESALKKSTDLDNILKKYHPKKDNRPTVDDIMNIMRNAAGKIKTIPKIEISYEELSEYFKTGLYPPEIEEFRDNMFFHVMECTEKKSWWDWGAFIVAMLGVAQIIAGVLLEIFTVGIGTHFAMALISEGIGDIAFAIQAGLSKNFSWKDYGIHKAISVAISIATAGIGAWLSRGAQVARFGAKAGFQLFKAVGGRVLRKLGEAVAFTLVDFGVEKLLDTIRQEIVNGCRSNISSSVSSSANVTTKELDEAMDTLYQNSYENGQAHRLIQDAFSTVLNDVTGGNVGREIYSRASQVTSELASKLGTASGKLASHGKTAAQNMNLGAGSNALTKAAKIAQVAKYIGKIIQATSIAKALMEMGTYAGEIIMRLIQKIKAIAVTLKQQKKSMTTTSSPQTEQDFVEFKNRFHGDVKVNIIDYIMAKIQSSMLQPAFNHLTHAALRKAGNAMAAKTNSMLKSLGKEQNIQVLTEFRRSNAKNETQITASLQGRVNPNELSPDTEVTVRSGKKSKDDPVITIQDAKSLYGDNVELYQDRKGRFYFQKPSFDQCINSFGGGKTAGFMELINCAKFMKATIKIEDLSGDLKTDSPDGCTYIKGTNSKDAPVIELVYTKNAEGVGHFQPKINGVIFDLPQLSASDKNTCLYQSLQFVHKDFGDRGDAFTASPEAFLAAAKNYALGSNTMKTLFKQGVYELAAKFQAGMPTQRTLTKDELANLNLSQSSVGAKTGDGKLTLEDLKTSMEIFGWGDNTPIDVVDMGSGVLTSLDNRRVVCAKVSKEVDVKANVWERDEIMPPEQAKRYGPKTHTAGQAAHNRMRKGSLDDLNCPGFSTMNGVPHNKVRIRSKPNESLKSFEDHGFIVSNVPRREYNDARNKWNPKRKDARQNKPKPAREE